MDEAQPDYIISDLWPLIVGIDEVQIDPSNAMTHDEANLAQIAGSLNKHKQRKPIVINRATGTIEAGNGTLLAARRLGWQYIAAVGEEDDAQTAVSYGIADNAVASQAWDWERLKKHLDTFDAPGEVPGVDDELLATLKEALAAEGLNGKKGDAAPQGDKAAELQLEYGTEVGQLWRLGEHRLAVGDCTDKGVVEAVMREEKVDLVLTDPPYAVNYGEKNRALNSIGPSNRIQTDIKNDTLSTEDTAELIWRPAFRNAYNKSRNGTVIYCFSPQGGDQMMMMMMMIKTEWNKRLHQLIWRKNSPTFSMGRLDYQYQHEPILYTWKGTNHGYYGEIGRSIIDCDRPNSSELHPTMKPVELLEIFITNSSKSNELVYDPFLGSGTTLIAAHQLNRRCRGIEIDPGYAAVALRRWEDLTGKKAEKMDNG